MRLTKTWLITGMVILMLAGAAETAEQTEEKGFIAYWSFDKGEGFVAKDHSSNNNDGNIHNAEWVEAKSGYGLKFNGKDSYVNCGKDASLDIADAITVEMWFKKTGNGSDSIYAADMLLRGNPEVWVYNGNKVLFCIGSTGDLGNYIGSYGRISVGHWVHFVGTYDRNGGANNMKIYLNGEVDAEGTKTNQIRTGNTLSIGKFVSSGFFNGIIDEVRIYNRALSADEIKSNYLSPAHNKKKGEEFALLKGPYLQNLGKDKVTIMWETDLPLSSKVSFWRDEEQKKEEIIENKEKIHEVTIHNLIPDTLYYYRIFSECNGDAIEREGSFVTFPAKFKSFNFVFFGDSRSQPEKFSNVIEAVSKEKIAFLIHNDLKCPSF